MIQIKKKELEELIECLGEHRIHPIDRIRDAKSLLLRAMIEPLPGDEWVECEPSEATMVRIGGEGFGFTYSDNDVHDDYNAGVIDGCYFSGRGFRSLKATFHKPKPTEPVVIETDAILQEMYTTPVYRPVVPIAIDATRPFKVTFEQEAK